MIYAEAYVVCVAYEDDCNMHGWFPWNSLMIAMLYLKFPVNEIFGPLRAEMIVNFVQSTTYRDLSISSCDKALSLRKAE